VLICIDDDSSAGEALAKVWANIGGACCATSVLCILLLYCWTKDGSSVGKVVLREGLDVGTEVDSSVVKVALRLWCSAVLIAASCSAVLIAAMGVGIVLI